MKRLLLLSFLICYNALGQVQVSNVTSGVYESLGPNFKIIDKDSKNILISDDAGMIWNLYNDNNQIALKYLGSKISATILFKDKLYFIVLNNLFKVENGQIIQINLQNSPQVWGFAVINGELYLSDSQDIYRFDEKSEQLIDGYNKKLINFPPVYPTVSSLGKYFFTSESSIAISNNENGKLNFTKIPIEATAAYNYLNNFPIKDEFIFYNGKYHARWNATKGTYFLSIDPQTQKVDYINLIANTIRQEDVRFDKYIYQNELIYYSSFDKLAELYLSYFYPKILNEHRVYRINSENKVRKQIIRLPENHSIISSTLTNQQKHYFISQDSNKEYFINEIDIETEERKSKKLNLDFTWKYCNSCNDNNSPKLQWTKDKQAIAVGQLLFIDTKSLDSYRLGSEQAYLGAIGDKDMVCYKNINNEFEFVEMDFKNRAIIKPIRKVQSFRGSTYTMQYDDEIILSKLLFYGGYSNNFTYSFYNENNEIRKPIQGVLEFPFKINNQKFILNTYRSSYDNVNDEIINIDKNEKIVINTDRNVTLYDLKKWNDVLYVTNSNNAFLYFEYPNFEKKKWFTVADWKQLDAGYSELTLTEAVKFLGKNVIFSRVVRSQGNKNGNYTKIEILYANKIGGELKPLMSDTFLSDFKFIGQDKERSFYLADYTNDGSAIWYFDENTQKLSKVVDSNKIFIYNKADKYFIYYMQNDVFYFDMESLKSIKLNLPEDEKFRNNQLFYYDNKFIKISNRSSNELFAFDLGTNKFERINIKLPLYLLKNNSKGIFFTTNYTDLWITDGTQEGTKLLKTEANKNSSQLTTINDKAYFSAFTPEYGYEAWESDGTTEGTKLIADIIKGPIGSNPSNFVSINGKLLCTAETPDWGRQLFRIEGINTITSTEEEKSEIEFIKIYPNPTTESIFVDTEGNQKFEYQLVDVNGKVLINSNLDNTKNQIQLHSFSSGIYFLRLSNDKKNKTFKIVKL